MSAARLAAETAFSAARPPSAEQPPTVIVRRSRVFGVAAGSVAASPGAPDGPVAAGASKGPRVFRLGPSAPQAADSGAGEAGPETSASAAAAASQIASPAEIPAGRRKRRLAAEQRPGPVVQIFKAPPAAPSEDPAGTRRETDAARSAGPTRAQLTALAEMLAGVQTILEDIQRARALRFLDSESASAVG